MPIAKKKKKSGNVLNAPRSSSSGDLIKFNTSKEPTFQKNCIYDIGVDVWMNGGLKVYNGISAKGPSSF